MKTQAAQPTVAKPPPALRLVGTKQLPRDAWLAVRKGGIGSSDAAAAVGLNPYKSQLELRMEKTERDALLPKLDPQDEESARILGQHPRTHRCIALQQTYGPTSTADQCCAATP